MRRAFSLMLICTALAACGDGDRDNEVEADEIGVGAECSVNDDCNQDDGTQVCLTQFKGGYCGIEDCQDDAECPDGSACVRHEGANYCFRICVDKAECNANRGVDEESNCSSNVEFVEDNKSVKTCVPPS